MIYFNEIIKDQVEKQNKILDKRVSLHGVTKDTAKDFEFSTQEIGGFRIYKLYKDGKIISELKMEFIGINFVG